jgi:formate dehydrogenase subunit delta
MSPDKLVRMANQIATFFSSQPGEDKVERVAAHLKDFWGPEMRSELKQYAKAGMTTISTSLSSGRCR